MAHSKGRYNKPKILSLVFLLLSLPHAEEPGYLTENQYQRMWSCLLAQNLCKEWATPNFCILMRSCLPCDRMEFGNSQSIPLSIATERNVLFLSCSLIGQVASRLTSYGEI